MHPQGNGKSFIRHYLYQMTTILMESPIDPMAAVQLPRHIWHVTWPRGRSMVQGSGSRLSACLTTFPS
jgi:hypothetical protein